MPMKAGHSRTHPALAVLGPGSRPRPTLSGIAPGMSPREYGHRDLLNLVGQRRRVLVANQDFMSWGQVTNFMRKGKSWNERVESGRAC